MQVAAGQFLLIEADECFLGHRPFKQLTLLGLGAIAQVQVIRLAMFHALINPSADAGALNLIDSRRAVAIACNRLRSADGFGLKRHDI